MAVTVEQVKEMVGTDPFVIGETKYEINKTNLLKYTANKKAAGATILERFRKTRGIVVKEIVKGDTKK